MELSDLTAYAEEKYQIKEEFKWTDFPGFSVLREPVSGKWVALLMRQWDSDSGTQIELCDIKCGEETLLDAQFAPYLSSPFRMRGTKWAGLRIDNSTNSEVVFQLFDKAMQSNTQPLYNFSLGNEATSTTTLFKETPLPQAPARPLLPERIRTMTQICKFEKNNSYFLKCKRFSLQGDYMEDYEDDFPCDEEFWCFLPTYHDLTIKQIRGYFTWRTQLRRGEFRCSATPFAHIYFYELLNGIGVSSPEQAFQKMEEFKAEFLDSGAWSNLHKPLFEKWMFEYAVIYGLPVENALKYASPSWLATDKAFGSLRKAEAATDEEVVAALLAFAPKTTASSPVFSVTEDKGKHLFAEAWRRAASQFSEGGKDLFTLCFGAAQTHSWYPLTNAVYWERRQLEDVEYTLNDYHHFHCHNGFWQETCFSATSVDSIRIKAFLHETDRKLRKYLKAGSTLREKKDEAWATPFVDAAIEADKKAAAEAAKPKITIDLSGLAQIRQDALLTQNSLLTEEERQEEAPTPLVRTACAPPAEGSCNAASAPPQEPTPLVRTACAPPAGGPCNAASAPPQEPTPPCEPPAVLTARSFRARVPLDEVQTTVLQLLLEGKNTKELLKAHHLMPSIVTDAINEALFDEIGDNVLECEDDTISIIEDYREDITNLFGENTL
ncbi:MAG: TerB N-terminal domain-containing protein [Victivallales bacterium]|nr:TerB N-terminal domain-containing protein [Victivallales bacterium]